MPIYILPDVSWCWLLQVGSRQVTGGAAKSIQSINVAVVVVVVVVVAAAAAVAVAGLASPAATHRIKKLRMWSITALFHSLFQFFGAAISFFKCSCSTLKSFGSKGVQMIFLLFLLFLLGIFQRDYGASGKSVFASFCEIIFKCCSPTSPRTSSATSRSLA